MKDHLKLTFGETVNATIYNNATHPLTIHWHGVKQPRNPWSDGPEYVTQCPIKPGSSFTYEIVLSDEVGTMWWHAHSDWSRSTVYGSMYIYPDETKQLSAYKYPITPDAEQEIMFGTWFDVDVNEMVENYLEDGVDFSNPVALTINGQPGDEYRTESCTADRFVMTVESGKTYLLRIINAAMNEDLTFGVANHSFTVVGSDAAYLDPLPRDYIMIAPGQTMDVLMIANQNPGIYYYMEAQYRGFYQLSTRGIVQYADNPPLPGVPISPDLPTTDTVSNFTIAFRALSSVEHDVPQTVDRRILMTVSLNNVTCGQNQSCINRIAASLTNVTFVMPTVDVLQAYWSSLSGVYTTDFPDTPLREFDYTNYTNDGIGIESSINGTKVFVVDFNTVVEIVFQGTNIIGAGSHPMHIHGYSFYRMASGSGNYNGTTDITNPPLINTVAIPSGGWTAVRFRADNPGVWFMHCHLERHAAYGMDAIMIVKNGTTEDTSIRPPPYPLTGSC